MWGSVIQWNMPNGGCENMHLKKYYSVNTSCATQCLHSVKLAKVLREVDRVKPQIGQRDLSFELQYTRDRETLKCF